MAPSRRYFGSHEAIVVGNDMDRDEAEKLTTAIVELCKGLSNSRHHQLITRYLPEAKLFSTLLYYGISIYSGESTFGQDYTSLAMAETVDSRQNLDETVPSISANRAISNFIRLVRSLTGLSDGLRFSNLTTRTKTLLVLLLGVLSYLEARHREMTAFIRDEWNGFCERGNSPFEGRMETVDGDISRPKLRPSSISFINKLWLNCGIDDADKFKCVLSIFGTIHRFLFLANGRYYDWALRLSGVSLFSDSPNDIDLRAIFSSNVKYRLASKSIALKVSLYAATLALVYIRNVVLPSGLYSMDAVNIEPEETFDRKTEERIEEPSPSVRVVKASPINRQCVLCMDPCISPSATPCGHVFCWKCIVLWCASGTVEMTMTNFDGSPYHRDATTTGGSLSLSSYLDYFWYGESRQSILGAPCPVCRTVVAAQQIRPIF